VPGCNGLAFSKAAQCDECRARAQRRKGQRGYDNEWRGISRDYLAIHPWCAEPDCIRLAQHTDHIDGDTANVAWSNLRGLCAYHHGQRTARDQPGGSILNQ
jgi:hypothetical protein